MSATSSDTESSCGWTIISNEASDIETLGAEATVEYVADPLERPPVVEPEHQNKPPSQAAVGQSCEERDGGDTFGEQTTDTTTEAAASTIGKEHLVPLSSSDLSDIMTLGDLKEDEHRAVEDEIAAGEEFYLGTSCSSQYAFTAAETVFPAQQPTVINSSSSEDDGRGSTGILARNSSTVRRRRLRKSATCVVAEHEDDVLESGSSEEEKEEEMAVKEQKQLVVQPEHTDVAVPVPEQGQRSSILNTCILLALVIAISMGFGHFYGTIQIQERQKSVEKMRVNELDLKNFLRHLKHPQVPSKRDDLDPDDQNMMALLPELVETQMNDLEMLLKQSAEEKRNAESQEQKLTLKNELLRSSLEREQQSLFTLQEELRNMHSKLRELEDRGEGVDFLLLENQRLKEQLEEERQLLQSFRGQSEESMAEAETLRKNLDKERQVTEELRKELNLLRGHLTGFEEEASSEAEELQARLAELEKRLSFELQRSDLWERLYVETKEKAKGETESKIKKPKAGMAVKVKETFDAVKNSTKEFVHHHKEQIKKAKEAVKENLRKFSDSVKSTFRNFKDSASTFINKATGFYHGKGDEKNSRESWQYGSRKPHHKHPWKTDESFHVNYNTRKQGDKADGERSQNTHKAHAKKCSSVFDCAYEESMNLFKKAIKPVRADEFSQILRRYLHQEVDHFHHWNELEMFINNFFHNGVFIHDQMLFTDFVSNVEDYLSDILEYHGLDDEVIENLDDYIYQHFFGNTYSKNYSPRGPSERPDRDSKQESRTRHHQRKHQKARSRQEQKWSRSGRSADRHMADVKIELGPMPFDPKY
ncbi:cell cycle progression protein 1-like isoform X2 [Thalassophryne amazonica]|uniref:cell cycle progression protein 1-like isoform X2 n=1 Tax=Thalassophryne amazonica TaxID=390379 RepID=UPI001471D4D4|nr:cell cycle progression protein 1-like isoform X2 [Thalassophryne amazonica]